MPRVGLRGGSRSSAGLLKRGLRWRYHRAPDSFTCNDRCQPTRKAAGRQLDLSSFRACVVNLLSPIIVITPRTRARGPVGPLGAPSCSKCLSPASIRKGDGNMNRLKQLERCGQSLWLDYLRRDLIEEGELLTLVERDGLKGVTSNPSIFEKA